MIRLQKIFKKKSITNAYLEKAALSAMVIQRRLLENGIARSYNVCVSKILTSELSIINILKRICAEYANERKDEKSCCINDRTLYVGDIVQHFKKEDSIIESLDYIYKICGFAKHTETEEMLVIYSSLKSDDEEIFARPAEMFFSKVDKDKYPNAKQEYRLEQLFKEDKYNGSKN